VIVCPTVLAAGTPGVPLVAGPVGRAVGGAARPNVVGVAIGGHAPAGSGAAWKSKAPLNGSAAASRALSGARLQFFSMKAAIEVVSYGVWSTVQRRAHGEIMMAGTREPGPN
jgi:hypothetical protein